MISNTQQIIEEKVTTDLDAAVCLVENESHMHGGSATESHFKLTLVSDYFSGMPRVKRHQHIYQLLKDELQGGVHALALHLYSAEEWRERGEEVADSPDCRGGSKKDSES